jgi:hypothetical protein
MTLFISNRARHDKKNAGSEINFQNGVIGSLVLDQALVRRGTIALASIVWTISPR